MTDLGGASARPLTPGCPRASGSLSAVALLLTGLPASGPMSSSTICATATSLPKVGLGPSRQTITSSTRRLAPAAPLPFSRQEASTACMSAHLEAALFVGFLAGEVTALTGWPRPHLAHCAIHGHLQQVDSVGCCPLARVFDALSARYQGTISSTHFECMSQWQRECKQQVGQLDAAWLTCSRTWLSRGSGVTGLLAFASISAAPF